ncbi:hypothetical protein Y1Q_0010534 [Alligator mississippiensis]|uniref:Uncharacterized protein n=1 Tax=Alligator mississippiensis TaxID=8496 RepID=A0A151NDC1_ALLMI|nr:hypothetical protein Y1Q_0010534 [Alligator mississippiensis]
MHGQEDTSPSSDFRLETPPELQRQIPWHAGHTEPAPASPPWSPIALVLGIMLLCLLFLITARIYGAQMCQPGTEQENSVMEGEHHSSKPTSYQKPSLPGTLRKQPKDTGEKCPVLWTAKQDSNGQQYHINPRVGCTCTTAYLLVLDLHEGRENADQASEAEEKI